MHTYMSVGPLSFSILQDPKTNLSQQPDLKIFEIGLSEKPKINFAKEINFSFYETQCCRNVDFTEFPALFEKKYLTFSFQLSIHAP